MSLPSAPATNRSKPSPLSAAKAIRLPSGDHAGSRSVAGDSARNARPPRPSWPEIQMRSKVEVARRLPSGDQAGSCTPDDGDGWAARPSAMVTMTAANAAPASARRIGLLAGRGANGIDDMPSRDAVTIHQFIRLAAARYLADAQTPNTDAGQRDGFTHRVADPAG